VHLVSAARSAVDVRQQSPRLSGRVGRWGAQPEQHRSRLQEAWQAENGITVDTKQWWVVVAEPGYTVSVTELFILWVWKIDHYVLIQYRLWQTRRCRKDPLYA